ncbi:MAG: response regulator [Nitrosomonadales bacterium]|nr:response regulator [Nitrosomonadales bacterium]
MSEGLSSAKVMIASDSVTDAELIKKYLEAEFDNVITSTEPDKAVEDFESHWPDVLMLVFNSLGKSERYYLELFRRSPQIHSHPHRTVILCNKDEVKHVYDLCKKELFDDYILYWPMTHDTTRLPMAVHHALRELAATSSSGPSLAEFAAQARRLAELEVLLEQMMAWGGKHIEVTRAAMAQAEHKIGAALDGFSMRLARDGVAMGHDESNDLISEIGRFKQEDMQQHFHAAAESVNNLKQWAQDFKQGYEPQLESVRALGAMAERVRYAILVVDDDELQHKIAGKILEEKNYHLVFARGGIEALKVLRKIRPDLILMDVMMPDMDGLEVVRYMKSAPQLANIPVIMITGKSDKKIVMESRKAGVVDFVVKPFDPDTLIGKIGQALH